LTQVAIFCSGSGSNAEALMRHFQFHKDIKISLLIYNRKEAGAKEKAEKFGIPSKYVPKAVFEDDSIAVVDILMKAGIDYILLAGFLLLIPPSIVEAYPDRILNIHPALLPEFGGKGMHGTFVHQAVKNSGANRTGISIHIVDLEYDKGKILFQSACPVWETDSESDIAARVLVLEHLHYSLVAEQYIISKKEKKV